MLVLVELLLPLGLEAGLEYAPHLDLDLAGDRAVRERRQPPGVGRPQVVHEDLLVVLIQPGEADRDERVAVLFGLDHLVLEVHVQVADLHGSGVDEELIHFADLVPVGRTHVPAADVRLPFGDLVVLEVVERLDALLLVRHILAS